MDGCTVLRACICGHSYVKRLYNQCQSRDDMDIQLNLNQCNITWVYQGGWTWDKFKDQQSGLPSIIQNQPDIVFCQLGSNDLDGPTDPYVLAHRAINIAKDLLQANIGIVILAEAIERGAVRDKDLTVDQYNAKVRAYNSALKSELIDCTKPRSSTDRFLNYNLWYWDHLRMRHSTMPLLAADLVHLSDHPGLTRFYRSVRLAIMQAARSLNY